MTTLRLDEITIPHEQTPPWDEIQAIAKSIQITGKVQAPIIVRPDALGYRLVAGAHQLLALRALGHHVAIVQVEEEGA